MVLAVNQAKKLKNDERAKDLLEFCIVIGLVYAI